MSYPTSAHRRYRWQGMLASAALALTLVGSMVPISQPVQAHDTSAIATRMTNLRQSSQRWIEIDLSRQRLIAWEGGTPVYAVVISTGKEATPTPTGSFAIQTKHRVARMQGADYDIGDVPYTMYYSGNYAIHGAYWHRRFGTPVSHGCVNVAVDHAGWLFDWATVGTPVVVHA
jgi:lipoprotein-anchoring transpeptidase ErfK/SrfK